MTRLDENKRFASIHDKVERLHFRIPVLIF